MKKNLISLLSAAVVTAGFATTASAELITDVIHTVNSTHSNLFEEVDGYQGTAAWRENVDESYYHYSVYYWDGTNIQLINPAGERAVSPSLYDGKIAYVAQNAYGSNIHSLKYWDGTYNNGTPHIVEIASGDRIMYPSLYDGRIAWAANDGNDWEVYYWDGTYNNGLPNITQITSNDEQARGVELDGNRIAWTEGGDRLTPATLYYWEGSTIETLNVDPSIAPSGSNIISADSGAIAWLGVDRNIYYWDGTFTGGAPNVVLAVPYLDEGGYGDLANPSLQDGRISYVRIEFWRPYGQEYAIHYWDGSNTAQISEWYSTDWGYTPSTTSNSVFYMGRNAITGLHEVRQVTSAGLCL